MRSKILCKLFSTLLITILVLQTLDPVWANTGVIPDERPDKLSESDITAREEIPKDTAEAADDLEPYVIG